MNTEQKKETAQMGVEKQSTKQLGLSKKQGSNSLYFKDINAYPIEMAVLEDGDGKHFCPTYYRKGLLTKDEMPNTINEAMKWLTGKKNMILTCRIIEVDKQFKRE